MAKGFSIMDIMSEMSREGATTESETIERVSVYDIQPNEDNFYEFSNIEELKNSIFAMGGVQQNLILVKLPEGSTHKYKALAGHRRREACLQLVLEGHKEFENVPAVIKENIDKDTEEALLVMTNSTQRTLTDWEKVMQHMKLKEIIPKLKKRQGLDGKTRALESDYLGVSEGQIGIYNTIGTKLNEWLMDWFKNGKIGISLAYEAAKLEPEQQEQLVEIAKDKGNFTEEDIKQLAGSRLIEGQLRLGLGEDKKVTESDTFEPEQDMPDNTEPSVSEEKPTEIPYSVNNLEHAISLIFDVAEFPTDKFGELKEMFKQGKNARVGYTSQQILFDKMLPYENSHVRVKYQYGYRVEFVHTNEIVKIPIYPFWRAFENYFEWEWKEKSQEQQSDIEEDEKVTESDTFEEEESPAAEDDIENENIALRGGYDNSLIDTLICNYETILEDAIERKNMNKIYEYNCLLDALNLLKQNVSE